MHADSSPPSITSLWALRRSHTDSQPPSRPAITVRLRSLVCSCFVWLWGFAQGVMFVLVGFLDYKVRSRLCHCRDA